MIERTPRAFCTFHIMIVHKFKLMESIGMDSGTSCFMNKFT